MKIYNVPRDFLETTAEKLGIYFYVQDYEDDMVKCRLWPKPGSKEWRAVGMNGRHRAGLCYHVQHYFMALVFAAYPDAIIQTFFHKWKYPLFNEGSKSWTANEIADRARIQTCECTSSMIEMTLVTPEEIIAGRKKRENITSRKRVRQGKKQKKDDPQRGKGRDKHI